MIFLMTSWHDIKINFMRGYKMKDIHKKENKKLKELEKLFNISIEIFDHDDYRAEPNSDLNIGIITSLMFKLVSLNIKLVI